MVLRVRIRLWSNFGFHLRKVFSVRQLAHIHQLHRRKPLGPPADPPRILRPACHVLTVTHPTQLASLHHALDLFARVVGVVAPWA